MLGGGESNKPDADYAEHADGRRLILLIIK